MNVRDFINVLKTYDGGAQVVDDFGNALVVGKQECVTELGDRSPVVEQE